MTVREICDDFVDAYSEVDPVRASRAFGTARAATHLTDYSSDGQEAIAQVLRRTLGQLAAAVPEDEAERLGHGYLGDACRAQLALIESGETESLVSELVGAPAMVRMSFDVMATDDDEAWSLIAARLEDVPRAMQGYQAALAGSADRSLVASGRLIEGVAAQCDTWAESWFSSFVDRYGDGGLRSRLDRAASAAAGSFAGLGTWLRDDLAGRAASADGVGAERYRIWGAYVLGTDLDVDEAYAWAIDELARIDREIAIECDRILPGSTFDAVRSHLNADPAGLVVGVDAFRSALQEIVDAAIDGLADVEFDIVAPLRRCVVGIQPGGSARAAYYVPPSEDLAQPGTTWFAPGDDHAFPMWEHPTTAYHEAVPGHHLQMGLLRVLPLVRAQRVGLNLGHAEGWALYAERLMDELGWFETPATRLGFLSQQAYRAARVIVDIGLHTGRDGWTYDRAVEQMIASGAPSRAYAESDVLRYLSWPAQAPSYKLGERTWLDGRAEATRSMGTRFDRKAWHAQALGLGPLGLDRLEVELKAIADATPGGEGRGAGDAAVGEQG